MAKDLAALVSETLEKQNARIEELRLRMAAEYDKGRLQGIVDERKRLRGTIDSLQRHVNGMHRDMMALLVLLNEDTSGMRVSAPVRTIANDESGEEPRPRRVVSEEGRRALAENLRKAREEKARKKAEAA